MYIYIIRTNVIPSVRMIKITLQQLAHAVFLGSLQDLQQETFTSSSGFTGFAICRHNHTTKIAKIIIKSAPGKTSNGIIDLNRTEGKKSMHKYIE